MNFNFGSLISTDSVAFAQTVAAGAVAAQTSMAFSRWITQDSLLLLAVLALIGLTVGLGHALATKEPLPMRRVIGKTLTSVGVSLVAGAIYYFKPETDPVVVLGLGALLSVLGAGWLESAVTKRTGVSNPGGTSDDGA